MTKHKLFGNSSIVCTVTVVILFIEFSGKDRGKLMKEVLYIF